MSRRWTNQRGIALIIVLLMISIIIAVTLQMNRSSRSEIYEAANFSDSVQLRSIAESGFYAGEAILLSDRNQFDALTELWANTELLALKSEALFENGSFKLAIEDEGGKLAINGLVKDGKFNDTVKDLLSRLLTGAYFRLDQRKADDLLAAIKDWIDTDDEVTGSGGAEGAYYAGLAHPYAVKNAPLDCIEELLMVKGVSTELFYGTADSPGLVQCLTVFGDGKININTAPKPVLLALATGMTAKEVALFEEYRRDERNNLSDGLWYQKVLQPTGVAISPGIVIKVMSDTFRVTAIGLKGRLAEKITGLVKRDADRKKIRLLSWKVE